MMTSELSRRLLDRAAFGPRPGDRKALEREGARAWLERQLRPVSIADPGMSERLAHFPDLGRRPEGLLDGVDGAKLMRSEPASYREAIATDEGMAKRRAVGRYMRGVGLQVVGARLVRGVHSRRQLQEVMVDFWANHFSVFAFKSPISGLLPHYDEEVLRRHALGRFEDLLLAVARSPAMLIYLDNWISTRPLPGPNGRTRGLNENYARELLELHTLGVDGGYTQEDVVGVARVFTGWSLRRRSDPVFTFRRFAHDRQPKHVMGTEVPGRFVEQGEWLLRWLARQPATARHVCRKLARRFVADEPSDALVERAARTWLTRDGSIADVVRTILLSPEFVDPSQRKVKTPLEFLLSALRETGGETDGSAAVVSLLRPLGEAPYFARSPEGFPDDVASWIDPAALLERISVAFALSHDRVEGTALGSTLPESAAPAVRAVGDISDFRQIAFLSIASPEFQWQ
jgi:uncharacterized protein (DUF1800 family)